MNTQPAPVTNVTHMGWFSSDLSIREYCDDIWKPAPVRVDFESTDGPGFLQSLQ
jgi:hypothetical protein